jgi:GntR family transcriptional regulator
MRSDRVHYLRIADALRLQVEGMPPTSLLPTEHQLAREFRVSRLTIRQALQLLEGAGLVSKQRGRGTIVSPPKIVRHWSPIATLEEDIQRQGVRLETRFLEYKREATPSPALRRRLGLGPDALVDVLTVLRLGDGRILCYDRRSFASAIGPVDPLRIEHQPVLEMLRERTGLSACTVSWEAEIVPSSTEVAEALRIKPGVLVVQTLGTAHLQDGSAIECVDSYYRVDHVKFQFEGEYVIGSPPGAASP